MVEVDRGEAPCGGEEAGAAQPLTLQRRHDAMARLSEAFRDGRSIGELSFSAGEAVGTTLNASRVGFGTLDAGNDTLFVDRDWTAPGVISLQGTTPLRQFGSYMDDWKVGRTVVVDNVYEDPRTAPGAKALDELGARSFVGVPVLERGRLVAVVYINCDYARRWSDEELFFAQEVAERTRTAVERARSEKALRDLNEVLEERVNSALAERKVFSDVVDGSAASVTVLDRDYRILAINRANINSFEQVFGKRPRVGDAFLDLFVHMPQHLAQAQSLWSRALSGEEFSVVDIFGDDAHDRRFYEVRFSALRDVVGKIIGASSTAYDVTDRIRAEQRLKDAEDFSRLALSAVGGVGVWTYDVGQDCFQFDDEIAELYALPKGSGAEGLSRQAFLANVHSDDVPVLRQTMSSGLVKAGDLELEYRVVHPDGSVRWVNSRGHTYFDEDGHPVRRTGVGVEVTRQRELEGALRQSQKMEAVGQLTGGIAHDFNNLLQGITGALELLQSRLAQGRYDAVERYVLAAQGAAKRAATLTQRLLAFSRRQTLDPIATNTNRLLADLQDLLKRSVGPTVDIELVGAAGVWPVLVDGNQLENAILNLCINARDAMPRGGRMTIETANKWLDEQSAREHELSPGQYVSICVSDTGTGMSKETISRIFDPFFTTKPLGEGTGLGLSMVYGFVRQSGGQVRVYSELGGGTTFCLYFPRHYSEAEIVDPLPGVLVPGAEGGGKTVLVVDDEPSIRLLVGEVLEDAGFRCIEASDGAAALMILQSNVHIDLLITDVGLPGGMNGRQVFDAARVLRPDLKTLFITGYAENAAVGNGFVDRHMGLLTKPFTIAALSSKISDMLGG